MIPDIERTIVALASGARPAKRAIVRLAGPNTATILSALCGLPLHPGVIGSIRLTSAEVQIYLPAIERTMPVRLIFWPDQRSYTGQPAAELHLLGSLPLAEAVIARCCELGAQPAERGEFTLRAFLAGKLDLAQAEAVLGVIEADSPAALKTALAQLGGNLAPAVKPLREIILQVVAELEAGLDFVDEDIEFISRSSLMTQLENVRNQLALFTARLATRTSTDSVPRVVLAGLPNSGKSSLFNALCQRPLAIVTDQAGTTRDYLQQRLTLGAVDVDLVDTAGWEELHDASPRGLAQQQLLACLDSAGLCLLCIDTKAAYEASALRAALSKAQNVPKQWLIVGTKIDDHHAQPNRLLALQTELSKCCMFATAPLLTSSRTGEGLNELGRAVSHALQSARDSTSPLAIVHHTAVRCRAALAAACVGVDAALELAATGGGEELIAAELRLVLDELAAIIGEVHSDDILGEIFSRFCIGK